jgi:hypothetical protein
VQDFADQMANHILFVRLFIKLAVQQFINAAIQPYSIVTLNS